MSLLPLRRALRGEIKKPSPEDPKFVNESLRTSLPPASCQKSYISVGQISTGPFVLPSLSALKCPLDTCPSLARPWLGHSFQRTAPTSFLPQLCQAPLSQCSLLLSPSYTPASAGRRSCCTPVSVLGRWPPLPATASWGP